MIKNYLKYLKFIVGLSLTFWVLFPNFKLNAQTISNQKINGVSGGNVQTSDCGYIANQANYTLNLSQKVDYLKVNLQTTGGQPTLLIVGPGPNDRFCVLGDGNSGLKPELSGVWEAGKYLIYVGDRSNSQHQFTLNISTQK
jgi:hypothetical protein